MKITEYNIRYDQQAQEKKERVEAAFDWVQSVVLAMTVMFIVFTFVFRPCSVVGDSMLDTLEDGNWLICTAFDRSPEYGEIIIITQPNSGRNKPIVKRVIATQGQTVDIDFKTGVVKVDGETLNEPYIRNTTHLKQDVDFPLVVPEGHLFVMGDNRNVSQDSRSSVIGFIDTRYVLGKVVFRFYPFNEMKLIRHAEKQTVNDG